MPNCSTDRLFAYKQLVKLFFLRIANYQIFDRNIPVSCYSKTDTVNIVQLLYSETISIWSLFRCSVLLLKLLIRRRKNALFSNQLSKKLQKKYVDCFCG